MPADRPEEHSYSFFEDFDDDHGIFHDRKDPVGSYGDPDAVEDLQAEEGVGPIVMGLGMDGILQVGTEFDLMAVLTAPAQVTNNELVCLAGPCKHYFDCVVQTDSGGTTIERRCLRSRDWAEPIKLDDAYIEACSGHELDGEPTLEVKERLKLNRLKLLERNIKATQAIGHSLGVCYDAGCAHYMVMVVGALNGMGEVEMGPKRFCLLRGGAARLKQLDPYQPVLACRLLKPGIQSDILTRNELLLEARRMQDATRGSGGGDSPGSGGEPEV